MTPDRNLDLLAFDAALDTAITELNAASDLARSLGMHKEAANLALVAFIVTTTRKQHVMLVTAARASVNQIAQEPPF